MTSKEALEKLLKIAYVEPGPTKEKFITYARETEHNKTCSDLYNAIEQDLERYEYICDLLKRCIEKIELHPNIFPSNFYRLIIDLTEQELELLKEVLNDVKLFK